MDAWEFIKQQLALKLSPDSFQNWFAATSFHSLDGESLLVWVPSEATRQYVQQEYGEKIRSIVRELRLPITEISYVVGVPEVQRLNQANGSGAREVSFQSLPAQLNPKFTFESFVVGSCNQFAHAAAKAVADKPARQYNPLFIYGGVGMGKTHLIQAIGHALLERHNGMNIVFTSAERFMNEMIASIKMNRILAFHRHYRTADVLLVDDIQVLSGKEGTQEEFFFTFKELHEQEKQIVLSGDSHPKEIPGLFERLRSRFEWGLTVDIQPPDLETKMAILDKKAEAEGISLPEEVRIFIATKTRSNVRELEGALTRLLAYSSITNTRITLPMAQQALKHMLHNHERKITIEAIVRTVATRFELQPAQLKQKSNQRQITYPRQIAMYLAKELTQASLPEIGRAFGGKHHTTVLHSVHKIERDRQKDPDLNRTIHSLIDSLS